MFNSITSLFKQLIDGNDLGQSPTISPNLAIACLLCEVAGADNQINQQEKEAKQHLVERLLNLDNEAAVQLLEQAEQQVQQSASLYDFTSQLRELSHEVRIQLVEGMWEVAHADGEIDPLEDSVIRKAAELLYVNHSEFIRSKLNVIGDK
ncbi:TerB family tellurite resistance protein [Vibrio sp. T187]|uniref:tellurite resistance TerB family protein n=1 Tax=Vibrio TaxID=662 RepID=UPI0010CA08C8|nr:MULTISPECIES: TerB family tellurite resistance protein [Vibrio]MBW3694861.1 TerB family tellurite resistance protein [Vibrio sp. T187]